MSLLRLCVDLPMFWPLSDRSIKFLWKAPLLLAKNQYLYWFDVSGLRRANALAVYDAAAVGTPLAAQVLAPRDLWGEMLLGGS